MAEPLDLWDFETWRKRFPSPALLHDGVLIAETRGGEWIALTMLMASNKSGQLQTGLTGVLAPWRGRGVASALKLAAIGYALERGATEIVTRNHSVNRGMLGINRRLGFVPDPAWLTLRLDLEPGSTA
jgi:GNAT superfamily N-acetyltransferase